MFGLLITVLLVSFQFWYSNASAQERERVPGWVNELASDIAWGIYEVSDGVNDAFRPALKRGWEKALTMLDLMAEKTPPRQGLVATDLDLSGQAFVARRLDEASFQNSTLHGADFTKTYLIRSLFDGVKAHEATFDGAVLERASMRAADFTGSTFDGADLSGALLDGSHLTGADLRGAIGLTQVQLDMACGDEATQLPDGLHVEACGPVPKKIR
nr:pentapeptide repeat-containing protein [Parvularcula dongshanensis]